MSADVFFRLLKRPSLAFLVGFAIGFAFGCWIFQ